jgi:hypothetical protein
VALNPALRCYGGTTATPAPRPRRKGPFGDRQDSRQRILSLTSAGKDTFSLLDTRSREEVGQMLGDLRRGSKAPSRGHEDHREPLEQGPQVLQTLYLVPARAAGDMGWVVHRHGVLYARE